MELELEKNDEFILNFPKDCSSSLKKKEIKKRDKAQNFERLIDYINKSDLDAVIVSLKGFLKFSIYN